MIGKPISVGPAATEITPQQIEALHETFVKEMQRLFDRTKVKYPEYAEAKLEVY